MNHLLPVTQALGWTIVHSIWQIAAIWVVFRLLSWRLQRQNNAVYLLALGAMLVAVIWSAATFYAAYERFSLVETASSVSFSPPETVILTGSQDFATPEHISQNFPAIAAGWFDSHAAEIGWAWGICAILLYLRLLGGYWLAHRLRHKGVTVAADSFISLCQHWSRQLNIRQYVNLMESSQVTEPLTIGFWKPVVLFPAGLLTQLTPEQAEVLLLHELAHIRRHDYLVNLFQLLLEVCFFYHPLFWLLSREARVRREYCCDDIVVRHTSDALLYAQTLTNLQISIVQLQNQFTMQATGKSNFTERILRIAGITPKNSLRSNWFPVLLLPLLIGFTTWWPLNAQNGSASTNAKINSEIVSGESSGKRIKRDTVPPHRTTSPRNNHTAPVPPGPGGSSETASPVGAGNVKSEPQNVAIQAVKMNVFYIGVDNPLRVAASGVPDNELSVQLIGSGEIMGSDGSYVVHVNQPGEVIIKVFSRQNGQETLLSEQKYRVKRIPDPTPRMAGNKSQSVSLKTLLDARGVEAMLENFDFDAYCEVMGYELTIVPLKGDATTFNVTGSEFPANARELFKKLEATGGAVFMDEIKVKCPGDAAARHVGGLAFKIKNSE